MLSYLTLKVLFQSTKDNTKYLISQSCPPSQIESNCIDISQILSPAKLSWFQYVRKHHYKLYLFILFLHKKI